MAQRADEMFVGKTEGDQVDVEKEKEREAQRLNNNGMNRDRTDKNAVSDDFDFANMRGNLGKDGPAPSSADPDRINSAAARTGQVPGTRDFLKQDKMFVANKEKEQVDVEKEKERDAARLNNNGMNRDRTDKNAVADDFDFANLRAGLGRKKKQPEDAPSAAPSAAPTPSGGAQPTVQPPTPQQNLAASPAGSGGPSRQGSVTSMPQASKPAVSRQASAIGSPLENPTSPPSAQVTAASGAPAGAASAAAMSRQSSTRSVAQMSASGAAASPQPLQSMPSASRNSRAPSVTSASGASPAAGAGSGAGGGGASAAGSAHGSQPALSRQSSAASKHSIARSQHSHHSAVVPGTPVPAYVSAPPSERAPAPQVSTPQRAPESPVDLTGVDWKLTADHLKKQLAKAEKNLGKAEDDLKSERQTNAQLTSQISSLEARLLEANSPKSKRLSTGSSTAAGATRRELDTARGKVQELQVQLAEKDEALRKAGGQHHSADLRMLEELRRDVHRMRAEGEKKDATIAQLSAQLNASHEAMLSAAQKGFEYDIKLHQARATLVTMVNGSPQRAASQRAASQPLTQSSPQPAQHSPVPQHPYSPQQASPAGYRGHASVSPTRNTVRTPRMALS